LGKKKLEIIKNWTYILHNENNFVKDLMDALLNSYWFIPIYEDCWLIRLLNCWIVIFLDCWIVKFWIYSQHVIWSEKITSCYENIVVCDQNKIKINKNLKKRFKKCLKSYIMIWHNSARHITLGPHNVHVEILKLKII